MPIGRGLEVCNLIPLVSSSETLQPSPAAARPWDTPLTVAGEDLALQKGREIAATMVEKFPQFQNVARAYCSPFLRCVQTLSRMIPSMPPGPVPLQICVEPAVCEFMAAEW